ncbi:unnamed protein product [Rotaria magnacalcarata]|uniref:Neurexin-4 n=2 Tax=Rotaria magnacalcarata TaxID=392030 RepID=A0A819I788_9BILA|nr:unnamed protein product [Rotaria magnacalcarata]
MNVEILIAASASNLSRRSELMILPGRSNMYGGLNPPTVTILQNQAAVSVPFQFSTAIRPADNPERMLNIPAEVVTLPPENGTFQGLPPEDADWSIEADTSHVDQLALIVINGLTTADIYSPCKRQPALGFEIGTIPDTAFSASSFVEGREPFRARLNDRFAWRPAFMESDQYLSINLGARYYVTGVATQGRRAAREYVTRYNIMYSDNGHNWFQYTNEDKIIVNFVGNRNDNGIVRNNFSDPFIARYIRFNPRQWNNFISMRVEVYGCPFTASSFTFDGQTIAYYDATFIPLHNQQDELRLRFKTNYPTGVLFYAKGTQNNDYLTVELRDGSIFVGLDLGSTPERPGATVIQAGSVLDDYQWHDLAITRYWKNISVKIDQTVIYEESQSAFNSLDLDGRLYIGGAPNHMERGISVRPNFQGCLENVIYVSPSTDAILDILQNLQRQIPFYGLEQGRVGSGALCEDDSLNMHSYTFKTFNAYLEIFRKPGASSIDVSFQMRTFEPNGILFYTNLSEPRYYMVGINDVPDQDFLRLFLDEGQLACTVQINGNKRTVRHRRINLHDGQWHEISLLLTQFRFNITVDYEPEFSNTQNNLSTTDLFTFSSNGGQIYRETSMNGFVGCLRQVIMSGIQILPRDIATNLTAVRANDNRPRTGAVINHGVLIDACEMFDRCTPNPCRHGGMCHQTWTRFHCDCSGTGYSGAVCHVSDMPLSCLDYKLNRMKVDEIIPERRTMIDIDGSGPLAPFPVICRYGSKTESLNLTEIGHYHELESYVPSGYQLPNLLYSQAINYLVPLLQLFSLIDRSYVCKQYIEYTCFNSRLLNYPNSPFGWWVGRTNQTMDYWGGSEIGTGKCSCGLDMTCANPNLFCNCDSQFTTELKDAGYLTRKEYLPVLRVEFGDTGPVGSPQYARYQVGRLNCEGDLLYDNTVTFRKADAIITVPPFEAKIAGDMRFQFKTGFNSATFGSAILVQNVGYDNGDLIEIRLQSPREIAFRYSVGRGTNIVTIRAPYDFNDNNWHTVHIEINRQEARLTVDDLSAANPEDQTTFRHIQLTSNLTIGASVTNRNGFVGCIRAFQVNGQLIDLKSQALRGMYGISPDCTGKCQSNPCLNGGRCNERWSTYDCDCTFTPFRGPICSTEIGTRLEANTMIKYIFPTQGVTATEEETIRVMFTTYKKQGILMQLKSDRIDEKGLIDYFTLELNNNGGVRVKFNYGFDTFEYNVPYDLTNGQNHEIIVTRRNQGKLIVISVDNYEPYIDVFPQTQQIDMQFDSPRFMYIGRNETTPPEEGFTGCISRLQFNRIFPLKYAFLEERDPSITWTGSSIREWPCGTEPVKYLPEPVEIPPDRGFSILALPRPMYKQYVYERNLALILGSMGFLFIFLLVGIGICYQKSNKSGHYKTKEDKGADQAIDADAAIIRGDSRHPDLTEAKEWIL